MLHVFTRPGVDLHAPPRSGVYAIFQGARALYVGQAVNLRDRLRDHLNERDNLLLGLMLRSGGARFTVVEVPVSMLDLTERRWIAEFLPICNRRAA